MALAGTVVKRVAKFMTGSVTPTGTSGKMTRKFFTGVIGPVGGPADFLPNDGLKTISGVTRDTAGVAVGSKTVKLFRQSDDFFCAQTTSNVSTGVFTFTRGSTDPNVYYVLAYDPSVQLHGVSDRSLAPT